MARSKTPKRPFSPHFQDAETAKISRLTNYLMKQGMKKKAMRILDESFALIEEKEQRPPMEVLSAAIVEITPKVEVKGRRVGGANLQVPVEVRPARQEQLWMRWLIQAARSRTEKTMSARLAYEIMAAAKGEGSAVKRRRNTHKSAESQKANSHFK